MFTNSHFYVSTSGFRSGMDACSDICETSSAVDHKVKTSDARREALIGGSLMNSSSLYRPLDPLKQELRLVRILYDNRGVGEDSHDITCEMIVVLLDSSDTPYTALSYCWTEAEPTCVVWINDIPVLIRPNLHAFLKRAQRERQQDWMFVDALCVNQAKIAERNQQVAAMGIVFHNAAKVIAWLGEPVFESSEMECRAQTCCRRMAWEAAGNPFADSVGHPRWKELETCLEIFLSEQYWSRVWIVQEIVLASSLELKAGSLFMGVKAFELLCERYKYFFAHLRKSDAMQRGIGKKILTFRKEYYPLPIIRVLSATIHNQCSHRHDKIYGILGLTRDLIEVDYEMSVMELVLRICIAGLLEQRFVHNRRNTFLTDCNFVTRLPKAFSIDYDPSLVAVILQTAMELCAEHIFGDCPDGTKKISWSPDDYPEKVYKTIKVDDHRRQLHAHLVAYHQTKRRADAAGPDSDTQRELNDLVAWVHDIFDEVVQRVFVFGPKPKSTADANEVDDVSFLE